MKLTQSATVSSGIADTALIAERFVRDLKREQGHASVFGLSGDLGSGKTTFTKEVANILGIQKDEVTSPTFVIEKIYKLKDDDNNLGFSHLIHIDAYRLESETELLHLGWEEIIANEKNLILIEWPERVKKILPEYTKHITFRFVDESTREITLP